MESNFLDTIKNSTGASDLFEIEVIQNLWSGYGKIYRYGLQGSDMKTVVVKHVRLPKKDNHPRGWNTNRSHERKLKSYQVETEWYKTFAMKCNDKCRVPKCFALDSKGDEVLMVLEDLDSSGFPLRKSNVSWNELKACLKWLANFHATFMHQKPLGLWEIGTYWHLDTRPDELQELDDLELKKAAKLIDEKLNQSTFKTFVHGDAKIANFCFSENGKSVAAVDFQYVGGGCGMKDVIYFIGSCLYEDDCERMEEQLLGHYFKELRKATKGKNINADALEKEYRELYTYAWTDFHRFLKGWSPDHWKINSYSERMSRQVIAELKG